MISIDEAVRRILESISPLPAEMVALTAARGRVLAEAVAAPRDLPPQDNSAMDGYAVRAADLGLAPVRLRVTGVVGAGHEVPGPVSPGEAVKIMTGAPMVAGADTVVPVEDTRAVGDEVEILSLPAPGANVRRAGEDVRKGDMVLPAGQRIRPAEVGMLAGLGRSFVPVRQSPRVAILSTGDEIEEIDAFARGEGVGSKIINSNSYGLHAQVEEAGGSPMILGIGRDDPEALLAMLGRAEAAHVLLTTGGVSMGDFDYVRDILARWGMVPVFWKVAVKPGKPTLFGMRGTMPVFGLPGNPVSAMVAFEQFVRPAMKKLQGARRLFRPVFGAVLDEAAGMLKNKEGRTEFVRCRVERSGGGFRVVSTKRRGSGMLSTLVEANALLVLRPDRAKVEPGEMVEVQLYDYEFLEGETPGWSEA